MLQTVFHIPHAIGGLPVFGFGWALLAWSVFCLVLFIQLTRKHGFGSQTWSFVLTAVVFGLIVVAVLPRLETDAGHGVPIRGYGVMLLVAVVSAVWVAVRRAKQAGVDPEVILALASWVFVAGILGARGFYVIQKWDQFAGSGPVETLLNIINVTEGGLVVYGSLAGAVGAFLVFCRHYKLPILLIGDLMAPSMLLGLAIGRIGCLLNGCCYGAPCERPWAVTFPRDTAPYLSQLENGLFHGFRLDTNEQGQVIAATVAANSQAEQAGLHGGDVITVINGRSVTPETSPVPLAAAKASTSERVLVDRDMSVQLTLGDTRKISWDAGQLPARSIPVHPTQIYSAITALVLFAAVLAYAPFRRRHGEIFAIVLTLYPVARFLLERIRVDEVGQWGTAFTISQLMSFLILAVAVGLWFTVLRQPRLPAVEAT